MCEVMYNFFCVRFFLSLLLSLSCLSVVYVLMTNKSIYLLYNMYFNGIRIPLY